MEGGGDQRWWKVWSETICWIQFRVQSLTSLEAIVSIWYHWWSLFISPCSSHSPSQTNFNHQHYLIAKPESWSRNRPACVDWPSLQPGAQWIHSRSSWGWRSDQNTWINLAFWTSLQAFDRNLTQHQMKKQEEGEKKIITTFLFKESTANTTAKSTDCSKKQPEIDELTVLMFYVSRWLRGANRFWYSTSQVKRREWMCIERKTFKDGWDGLFRFKGSHLMKINQSWRKSLRKVWSDRH